MQRTAAMFALAVPLIAGASATPAARVGDTVQIITDREMEEHGNRDDSPQGTSTDRDSYVERVAAVRADGIVLDYDLPANSTSEDRASSWQFPFQVLKTQDGTLRLLNVPALSARIDRWLKAAGMERAACGKLIFTWNAFRIDCDPQSIIQWLTVVTVPDRLDAGTSFSDPDARAAAMLMPVSPGRLAATLVVDAPTIRRQRAQTDIGVAELTRKPLTLDAALKAHENEAITGTIAISFDLDSTGRVRKRTRVRTVRTAWPNGRIDTQTVTDTVMRAPAL